MIEHMASPHCASPRWATHVLAAAAAYNVIWGLVAIFLPEQLFAWAGIPAPNYPSLVRCIGMIIGVYGLGFAIAARDPITHWPIVLLGLLGKILGPIGFAWSAAHGEFPWSAGYLLWTTDILWWLPFIAILLIAARAHDARRLKGVIGDLDHELRRARTASDESVWDLSQRQSVLLIPVRHAGCTFCRETLDDLRRIRPQLEQSGVRPVVVQMGSEKAGQELLHRHGLDGVDCISDPDRRLYAALDLSLATLSQTINLQILWRAIAEGALWRYGIGQMIGNGLQLSGAFLIQKGHIVKAFRARSTADRPSYVELACDRVGSAS